MTGILVDAEKLDSIHKSCDIIAKAGSEHAHQRAFFAWLAWMKHLNVYPKADRMFAIPNGGKRDPITAARLKAEGVKPGVPDTFYPVPSPGLMDGAMHVKASNVLFVKHCGLWLEFKKPQKGRERSQQSERMEWMIEDGYAVATVYSWRAAAHAFADYVYGRKVEREYV